MLKTALYDGVSSLKEGTLSNVRVSMVYVIRLKTGGKISKLGVPEDHHPLRASPVRFQMVSFSG